MDEQSDQQTEASVAAAILAEMQALPRRSTPDLRLIRQRYSQQLKNEPAEFILDLVGEILKIPGYRWIAYELLHDHRAAFQSLDEKMIETLGQGINSWWTVDSFGRTISGPAWLAGLVSDALVHTWARSADLWWRRAALVSTIALNSKRHGGYGDTARTLSVCRLLANDHEDMVVKAMSWALRELVPHDPQAVSAFLAENNQVLAARVKREVNNKMQTGLKNPKKHRDER
jgi:3-methyladenine DNA glycosylase AlkD